MHIRVYMDDIYRTKSDSDLYSLNVSHHHSENKNISQYSRYLTEFSNHTLIGKGGFGEIFITQHKLDNCWYALKKLNINNYQDVQHILSEIRNLAILAHPNIVRYYTSWVEKKTIADILPITSNNGKINEEDMLTLENTPRSNNHNISLTSTSSSVNLSPLMCCI